MENNAITQNTKEVFPELSIMKARRYDSLFKGRNLPSFVRDYILRRFTDNDGGSQLSRSILSALSSL